MTTSQRRSRRWRLSYHQVDLDVRRRLQLITKKIRSKTTPINYGENVEKTDCTSDEATSESDDDESETKLEVEIVKPSGRPQRSMTPINYNENNDYK